MSKPYLILILSVLCLVACNRPDVDAPEIVVVATYPEIVWTAHGRKSNAALDSLVQDASSLDLRIKAFLDQPSDANLASCRVAWLDLHGSLTETAFYFHATLNAGDISTLTDRIDKWPVEPGFLDSLPDYPMSGIINDITLPLDREHLESQHGLTAEEDVTLGLHAIEYLLWQRTPDDYHGQSELNEHQREDQLSIAQLSPNRRRTALGLISDILRTDLEQMRETLSSLDRDSNREANPIDAIQSGITQLSFLLDEDEERIHGSFASFPLDQLKTISSLMLQCYQDSNLAVIWNKWDEDSEREFMAAIEHLQDLSETATDLDAAARTEFRATSRLLSNLLGEFGSARISSQVSSD